MVSVMFERMLVGKQETIRSDTTVLKNFTVVVEPLECSIKSIEGVFSEDVEASKIAEVEESIQGFGDIRGDITLKCACKDLHKS